MSKIKVKQIEDLYIGPFVTREDVQGIQVVIGKKEVIVPKAIQGYQGVQGYQGFQGKSGVDGVQGVQGSKGVQGYQGLQGKNGTNGVQGAQGYQGESGVDGEDGVQGFQGYQGIQGTRGYQGFQGIQGYQGYQGYQGFQGKSGVDGEDGVQGFQGFQGIQGTRGYQGYRGYQGLIGTTGQQGPQGVQGIPGLTGNDGVQGLQGFQGIKGDGSEIRAREINETIPGLIEQKSYERKYINITNDGIQSVVSHALITPTISTEEVTLDLSSNNSLQIPNYVFDNAGHIKERNVTNVTFELGLETPEKTDWQTTPLAGLVSSRVPDESEYPTDIELDELKGWVYQGSLQTVKDLENLRVGDVIGFYEGSILADQNTRGQVYKLKDNYNNFLTQDDWTVSRYKGQMVGYTDSSSLTDASQLIDIAFMHHLPEWTKLAVITDEDELLYYKNKLSQIAEQYPDNYLEGYWSRTNYTHPETGEQINTGLLYWRIEKVDSVLDFGDELATASTTANQIATSTEKIYNKINTLSDSTFVSAWIPTLDKEEYEYNRTEGTYIWNISYSRLIQNDIDPETASVITLRQLQEDGLWKQLIPDVVFNDNKSRLEIHFSESPKNTMKVLVTGNRI